MSDQNIFNGQTTDQNVAQNNNNNVQNDNPLADLLGSIKNERGEPKYKDLQTALDALKHSQEFIPQLKTEKERLEQEAARLREENARLKTVQETVEQLTQQQRQETVHTNTNNLDPDAIVNLISQTLSQREVEATKKVNTSKVVDQMQQAFGNDAEKVFYDKAKELGMTAEDLNNLAAKTPVAVLQLFGIANKTLHQQPYKAPNTGSINTTGITPHKETFMGRNSKPVILGATSQELSVERENAVKLVNELHSQGLSAYDLTDPKVYFKHFGNA